MTILRLGPLLRERRGSRGIKAVAEDIGISAATLTRVEAGRLPDLQTFKKICVWLKIDPAEILDIQVDAKESAGADQIATPVAAVHLRAEKTLPPAAANDLAELIMVAHRELARRARGRGINVSSWI